MALDTSRPRDQDPVGDLPSYIRENRVAVNAIVAGASDIAQTNLSIDPATVSLVVGTDLSLAGFESVVVTGLGVATIATITGGTDGQVKIFIFQDANIAFTDGDARINGVFYLNQMPAGIDFNATRDDVLVLRNIGGDGAGVEGYWKELYRDISNKP